jgi:hypothetical protein
LCITVALVPIVALFLGCDALGFIEFREEVDLAGNLGLAPWPGSTASPHCLVPLGAAAAVEGFRGTEDGDPFLGDRG